MTDKKGRNGQDENELADADGALRSAAIEHVDFAVGVGEDEGISQGVGVFFYTVLRDGRCGVRAFPCLFRIQDSPMNIPVGSPRDSSMGG
jgi:hypothetical protein